MVGKHLYLQYHCYEFVAQMNPPFQVIESMYKGMVIRWGGGTKAPSISSAENQLVSVSTHRSKGGHRPNTTTFDSN